MSPSNTNNLEADPGGGQPSSPRVVGIGASAGGLEVLEQLFKHMPADTGFAFVVIQHLAPDHTSMLPQLLGHHTKMPVVEATDGATPQADHVYVIGPGARLGISKGMFQVRGLDRERRDAIDAFLRSLAEAQGQNAVGILLSGSGTDGTDGLRAIKEQGGLTLAQQPETAQYDSMPRSAIEAGVVEHVLPVDQMPAKLLSRERGPIATPPAAGTPAGAATPSEGQLVAALGRIFELLQHATGHDFSNYKRGTVLRRLRRRLEARRPSSLDEYIDLLAKDAQEPELLAKELLISVTQFFRDPEAFEYLDRHVLPQILAAGRTEVGVRIWVAGCASGEEAYSMGILIREQIAGLHPPPAIHIFATDIDAAAIAEARVARYSADIAQHVSPERLARFFTQHGSYYQVAKEVRDLCIFSEHSLIRDPPFLGLDLVSCRNLLIYLDAELQTRLGPVFHYALKPGGTLFLGPTEGLVGHRELFEVVDKRFRIFKRTESLTRPLVEFPFGGRAAPRVRLPLPPAPALPQHREPAVSAAFERLVLQEYVPPGAVVNERGDVLCVVGPTGRFLQPPAGLLTTNILEIAYTSLRIELRTALHAAARSGKKVVRDNVQVEVDDAPRRLRLIVRPLSGVKQQDLFAVILQDQGGETEAKIREPGGAQETLPESGSALEQLESELCTTRANLRATIAELESANQELKSTNEEMLSTNEEMQSANEELQSSQEELKSVNEELATVNAELGRKVDELGQANSDLQNLFTSTDLATLFLDCGQRVARFTPAAKALFRLIEADVGRPLSDLAPRFVGLNFAADVSEVLRTLTPIERQAETVDRQAWYLLRIVPYRTTANVIAGAVLTLADITKIKHAEADLQRLATVVLDSNDAITVQDLQGNILEWNRAAERIYGYSADEARKMNADALVPEEDRAQRRGFLAAIQRGEEIAQLQVRRRTKDGRLLDVWLTTTKLLDDQGRPFGMATTERDITELKRAQEVLHSDLDATNRLLKIGSLFVQEGNIESLLGEVVEAAIAITGADFGNIQLQDRDSGDLKIVAHRGFPQWWLEFWSRVTVGQGACGTAFERKERVIVEDVETSPIFAGTPAGEIQRRAGVRAVQSTPLLGRTGSPLGMLSTHYKTPGKPSERALRMLDLVVRQTADILERAQAQAALRESEARFRALTEACAEGLYCMSPDWSEMRRLHSRGFLANTDTPSRTWLKDYIPPDDQPHVMAAIHEAIGTKGLFELEHPVRRIDGTLGWTSSRAVPIKNASGEIVEWFGTASDVTKRKQAELALAAANARLREEDERKNEFLGMLSHELRNPLTPIQNSLSVLRQASPGGEQALRAQAVIERQVEHMAHLVDDLLDITRITHGKVQLARQPLDLNELARQTVEDHRELFNESGVELDLQAAPAEVFVNGDRTRLMQVIGNLLRNASKFTPRGGKTTVSVQGDFASGQAIVRVKDTGCGIAKEMLPRLFQAFAQADMTLDRSKGGLGLGLSLVKDLVEMHGGSVRAASDGPGKGAAVTIVLPLETARPIEPSPPPVPPATTASNARRILIIEDNLDAANSLREALELSGHQVEVAYDGPEGIRKARAFLPDVVLSDLGLPEIDGYEVARTLRADPQLGRITLVAMSGYARAKDVARAKEAGFDAHLAKPPNLQALEKTLAGIGNAPR